MNHENTSSSLKHTEAEENNTVDIKILFGDFIKGLRKFWWLVAVLAAIFAFFFLIVERAMFTPIYASQATFTVSVNSESNEHSFFYESATAEQLGLTFPHILSSDLFLEAMAKDMGTDEIKASVDMETIPNSNMVTMTAKSNNPKEAQAVLQSAIKVYPDVAKFVIGSIRFHMIDNPTFPTEPINEGNYQKAIVFGALLGLLLGLGLVALYAFFRKTIHSTEEIENVMNLSCLVSLPALKRKKRSKQQAYFPLISEKHTNAAFLETVEALRIRIDNELQQRGAEKKVLLVTSTLQGEGKSLITTNLALSLGRHGKKVLLIDGDFRKQNLANQLGIAAHTDFAKLQPATDALEQLFFYDEMHKIYFFGSNQSMENTAGFLATTFKELVARAREEFDYILIDTPPASDFEDALVMNASADAVLYIVRYDYAAKNHVLETLTAFHADSKKTDSKVIGYVFNGITGLFGESEPKSNYGYGYGYGPKYSTYGAYGDESRKS